MGVACHTLHCLHVYIYSIVRYAFFLYIDMCHVCNYTGTFRLFAKNDISMLGNCQRLYGIAVGIYMVYIWYIINSIYILEN